MKRLGPIVVTLSLAGCAGDASGLWITIDAPEGRVDRLVLEMVATLTQATDEQAETCRVFTAEVPNDEIATLELPFVWGIAFGDEPWWCMGVRVAGSYQGDEVVRTEDLYCPDPDLLTEETLRLDAACFGFECPLDRVCRVGDGGEARCEPSRVGDLFGVAPSVERPCDGGGQ
jgi:hypothetical protein